MAFFWKKAYVYPLWVSLPPLRQSIGKISFFKIPRQCLPSEFFFSCFFVFFCFFSCFLCFFVFFRQLGPYPKNVKTCFFKFYRKTQKCAKVCFLCIFAHFFLFFWKFSLTLPLLFFEIEAAVHTRKLFFRVFRVFPCPDTVGVRNQGYGRKKKSKRTKPPFWQAIRQLFRRF